MNEFDNLKINSYSDVELVEQNNGKEFRLLLLSMNVNLTYKNDLDYVYNGKTEDVPFYYVVQIVEGTINDTALGEDNTNELWLDIKDSVPAEIINTIKNKIESVFNLYLRKKELV